MQSKRVSMILAALMMAATVFAGPVRAENLVDFPSEEGGYDADSVFVDSATGYVVVTEVDYWVFMDSSVAVDCINWRFYWNVLPGLDEYDADWRSESWPITDEDYTWLANRFCPIRGSLRVGNIP